jgi:hypothetical protein
MSKVTHLASGALTRSGDMLTVELIQPDSMPAAVRVVWPAKPSVTAPTPKALAALASAMVRTLAGRNSPRRPRTADDRCRRAMLALELTDAGTATRDRAPAGPGRGSVHPLPSRRISRTLRLPFALA